MNVTLLQHDPRLRATDAAAGPIPVGWSPPDPAAAVVSFRPPGKGAPAAVVHRMNATTRFLAPLGDHVAFYGLETDSGLAPLIFWDAAHVLPVGGTITVAGDPGVEPYLGREYFRLGLTVESADPKAATTTFRKTGPLPAELDRGLDRWTFGVPTGPGDATGLNAVVKRILELGVPEFEVILCGRPGANFRYFDRVTIVGEDIVGMPVPIAAKKNRIAEAAKYENLCILHDRVFLPLDFLSVMKTFGDLFPVVGFQSMWFDDPWNLVCKRYSDYCRLYLPAPLVSVADEGRGVNTGPNGLYQVGLISEVERRGFITASALRYNQSNYCTGSLYVTKRRTWLGCPQDPRLKWQQIEDVEFGVRTSREGIPHRINPLAFTQSLFTRPQLLCLPLLYESANGDLIQSVNLLETARFRRKPLAKISTADAHRRLQQFARRWLPQYYLDTARGELAAWPDRTETWLRQIGVVVYAAAIGFGAENVGEFVTDYEKNLMYDTFNDDIRGHILESFCAHGPAARDTLAEHCLPIRNMLLYRPVGNLFYDSLAEYFPARTRGLAAGTYSSAWRLARHDGEVFHHPGGRAGYRQAIVNSTPYREYYEE